MNKADLLMAGLRQLAAGKTVPRTGIQSATVAKDGKDKAEHFREQLRLIAQGTKHVAKPAVEGAKKDATQGEEVADHVAKIADQIPTRSKGRTVEPDDVPSDQTAQEATSLPSDWRGPEAALSSVMSKLDHSHARSAPNDDATARPAQPQIQVERREAPSNVEEPTLNLKSDVVPDQRFTLSVESAETRTVPVLKVAVREQETHFEPVPQLTLLQKVVDRIGADIQAASTPASAGPADAALPDMHRAADKPVRMLTLQLEPPSIGSVTVRMRMAGDAVEIHLSADRAETTEMLRQERGALTDLMKSAGYTFDIASIDHTRTSDAGPGAGQSQTQSDQQQPQQSSYGGSQNGNGASERRSGDTQGETRHNRQGHEQRTEATERNHDRETAVVNRNGGAVYL
jgi:chemotaxis protein MotD